MSGVKIGSTDLAPPTFKVEREARGICFPKFQERKGFRSSILRSLDALLVWRAGIRENTVRFLARCKIALGYGMGYDQ